MTALTLSNNRATFVAASKAWLCEVVLPHPKLTAATKVVCTAIYGRFNTLHYNENGGELYAFPGWEELVALTGLSRETINQGLKQAEEYGVLRIDGGRRLASGRRGHNKYFATFPGQKSGPGPGQKSGRSPGQNYRDSPGQENRQEEVKERIRGERIRGESKPGQNYRVSDSNSVTAYLKKRLTSERPPAVAEGKQGPIKQALRESTPEFKKLLERQNAACGAACGHDHEPPGLGPPGDNIFDLE